jgi:uncharacterized membrane protein YhaH (DUF805 family)
MASEVFWQSYWWWWLIAILISFLVMEGLSIYKAHKTMQKDFTTWTLSDTIRRWSVQRKWLKFLVIVICLFLLWHFFFEIEPG